MKHFVQSYIFWSMVSHPESLDCYIASILLETKKIYWTVSFPKIPSICFIARSLFDSLVGRRVTAKRFLPLRLTGVSNLASVLREFRWEISELEVTCCYVLTRMLWSPHQLMTRVDSR